MEIFTEKEWKERFDELCKRAEDGEMIGIIKDDGTASIVLPSEKIIDS